MPHRRPIVLIVDDDRDTRDLFRTALRLAGFDVRTAVDGATALWQLDHQPPDLVVLDLDLPIVHGIAVHEDICSRSPHSPLPVVIVTGTELRSPHQAFATLQKPVWADVLVSTVRRALAQRAPA